MQRLIGLARALLSIWGQLPNATQGVVLSDLAVYTANLGSAQRYRRVLASFDQQEVKTGFTVRWDTEDVELVQVEGLRMHLDRADVSVCAPLAQGVYERHLTAFFRRFLREGMHVIDAGANIQAPTFFGFFRSRLPRVRVRPEYV